MKKTTSKHLLTFLLLLSIVFSLVACSSEGGNAADARPGAPEAEFGNGYLTDDAGDKVTGTAPTDRKIITTVRESVETEQYDAFIPALKNEVAAQGGYIVSSSYRGEGAANKGNRSASFELRIPAEKLTAFTDKVGTLATVLHHNESANDITMAYIDIESRITVLEAEETALLDIMKGATTTAELLQIREALTDVQGELASLRAQKKNYDTLVAYSTVHLSVEEVVAERAVSDGSFFSEVGASFSDSLGAVGTFFRGAGVFLLGNSPVLLLLAAVAVGVFFIARVIARAKGKRTPPENKD